MNAPPWVLLDHFQYLQERKESLWLAHDERVYCDWQNSRSGWGIAQQRCSRDILLIPHRRGFCR
jgi:hypothetical protein